MDGTGKQFAVSLQVEINRWLSSVKMTHLDNKNNVVLNGISPKYDYQNHVVIGSSAKSNIWVNLTTASESILANNFDNSSFGITKNSDDYAKNYIPWLATSIQDDRTTQYRNRVVKIDGVPGATNTPSNEYRYLGDTLNTNVFMVGQTNATLGVPGYMVFGSNDGMLKIYQSGAGNDKMKPYSYSLGAIPGMIPRDDYGTLYQAMYKRSTPGYAIRDENPHMFGVNGGLATRHTNRDHLFAVATTGQGGRGVFAVSIAGTKEGSTEVGSTPKKVGLSETKEKWGDSVPLWESSRLTNLNDNLGYTVGNPIIGVIAKYRDNSGKPKFDNVYQAAVVSNGYDGPKKENAALFVDALGVNIGESGIDQSAGSLIGKTSVTSSLSKHYGLSAPALVDLNLDGIADIAYAGDRNGDLYRIDLRKTDPTQWKLVKIYSGSPDKPITSAPAFSRFKKKQVVTFATGSSLYGTDLLFEKQQTIYGIFDTPDVADDVFTAITENDLVEQTFTTPELVGYIDANVNNKRSLRMLSNNPIGAAHRGWKIDLSISQDSGGKYNGHEQATTSINVVEGAVLLSTTWVRPDAFADLNSGTQVMCFRDLTNRTGSIMMINVLTGGSLTVKDTHMSATVNATISGGKVAGGSKVAISGYLTNDLTSPLLVYSNKMYTINKEGQFTLYNNAPNPVIAEGGVKTNYQLFPELGYCKDELCRQNVEEELKHCVDGKTGDAAEVISIGFTEGGEMKGGTITPCISSIDPIVKRLSWRIIS